MTYITILIALTLFIIIPIVSATQARLIHFTLGFQGQDFNINSIFGKLGFWLLTDSDSKIINLYKDAVTCIYCLTHHIAAIEAIVLYTILFGWWGLVTVFVIPGVSVMIQTYLQKTIYSQFYSDINDETNDGSN